ncbi:GntR family transcriptional regulator [Secundilactobacillus pentosiphilus]|uniref:GntR family transcriptional regulator n=1 Tax=Secundilactobacillus pentosiphilus TaxID=1714682 RepID=A0A1Z5ISR4_9LACO|nr:GntR family transcriptional regulator [Secundilactobacillus pentosiphilus]GAX04648.1 GntR family transcriptional regulator [Secundilactobacillus pentosiphilus]GAX05693.1 GntR family transcriptional regulator [Secundilactobacillus pentosiphilus]
MEFDDKVPIYYQIKTVIYDQIIAGQLAPGDKLPAVRQLAVSLTVNVNTVQRALREMIDEGVIISQRGKGNFVTDNADIVEQLKEKLINRYLKQFYDRLHRLKISNQQIIDEVTAYIERQGDLNDNNAES